MLGEGFKLKYALIDLAAWPYARALRYSTIQQAEDLRTSDSIDALESALSAWTDSKEKEFKYIAIAATVSAGANVSVFSWNDVPSTVWYARALWYMSLVFSIMTLISIVQVSVMVEDIKHYLTTSTAQKSWSSQVDSRSNPSGQQRRSSDPAPRTLHFDNNSGEKKRISSTRADAEHPPSNVGRSDFLSRSLKQCISLLLKRRRRPRLSRHLPRGPAGYSPTDWTLDGFMLFVWQSPMMFASYSWVAFLLALALHVIRPFLERTPWSDDHKIAITFLCVFFASLGVCVWCAWFPHYKRLRIEDEGREYEAAEISPMVQATPRTQKTGSVHDLEPV